jgi:AcrR family transcriptional regulator
MSDSSLPPPSPGTRSDLILAAMKLFGERGFDGTSTRDIAARAGTNVASIAYHFGGKEGLRLACAEEIARRLRAVAGEPRDHGALAPAQAAAAIEAMLRGVAAFVVASPQADDVVAFLLRELVAGNGGPAIDALYDSLFVPKHRELCTLWAAATGRDADSERVKITVFSLIGQVVYFRIGRPVVGRRMGWAAIGPAEAARIADVVVSNLRAVLEKERQP